MSRVEGLGFRVCFLKAGYPGDLSSIQGLQGRYAGFHLRLCRDHSDIHL